MLEPLQQLELLSVNDTAITERGLAHLERLTNLRVLTLPAGISDEGLNRMRQVLPECEIGRARPE